MSWDTLGSLGRVAGLAGIMLVAGCDLGSNGESPAAAEPPARAPAQSVTDGSQSTMGQETAPRESQNQSPDTQSSSTQDPSTQDPSTQDPNTQSANTGGSTGSGSNETIDVTFDDLQLPIQADIVFRPFMLTDQVKQLDGRRIRISGYMLPGVKSKGIKEFVLLKNTQCKFGPGGQADHLINVIMVQGETARFRDDPVSIEGVLKINPFQGPDGNTWSIYDLTCDHIETYRPRR